MNYRLDPPSTRPQYLDCECGERTREDDAISCFDARSLPEGNTHAGSVCDGYHCPECGRELRATDPDDLHADDYDRDDEGMR